MKLQIKTLITTGIALIFFSSLSAQDLPIPSPNARTIQRVGLTDIEIEYSRPGVKDRKIFGGLVPYGEIWRTGANKATKISFSTNVMVSGQSLEAGEYALFTIPGEDEWKVIFNTNTEQWGTSAYKEEENALTISVKPREADFMESMLFYVDNLRNSSATINLQWAETRITIPIKVESEAEAMKNIQEAIAELQGGFRVYNSSARYYLDNGKDVAQALEWAKKSVSMDKKYWNLTTLSMAYAANDMLKDAIKTAEEAKKLATEAKSEHYINLNTENIAKWKNK